MKYDLAGAHVLNKFVWSELTKEFPAYMSKDRYQNLVPIIPSQQVPVFTEMGSNHPFIVYTYTKTGYSCDFWDHTEQMAYTIHSENERYLRQLTNFISDLLRRYDETAMEVNDFVYGASTPVDSDDRKFDFKYVTVTGAMGPEPFTTEGGRQAATVNMRYAYTLNEETKRFMRTS